MNAFMAYKNLTVVDFENIHDHGLYLISGPTGSGKTTLFDAMTFALYGEASGSHRQASYFRSDFADAKEETYVELTFELHQHRYTVKRSPTYYREGYKTPKMAQAYFDDGQQIIEGIKEVNAKIKELLGVDVRQFKQIVMIAQGEFTKLIYASSEERERVLRHVFHSEPLVVFENLLKDKVKHYKDEFMMSNQDLSSRFSMLQLSSDFIQQHQEFHPSYIQDAQIENQKINEQLDLDQHFYHKVKNEYDKFSQQYYQKQEHNQQLLELEEVMKQYHQLQAQKEKMLLLEKDFEKIEHIKNHQSCIHQYKQSQTSYQQACFQKQEVEHKLSSLQQQFSLLKKEYQKLDEDKHQKDQLFIDIDNTKKALEQYQLYQKQRTTFQQQQKQYQALQNDYHDLQV